MSKKNPFHYRGTGQVVLKEITPIIHCFFDPFLIRPSVKGNPSQCTIVLKNKEQVSWGIILRNLIKHIKHLDLHHKIKGDDSILNCLMILAQHHNELSESQCEVLKTQLSGIYINEASYLKQIFKICTLVDDGHGLEQITFEAARYCDEYIISEFGGTSFFINRSICLSGETGDLIKCGDIIGNALNHSDAFGTATYLLSELHSKIDSISDRILAINVSRHLAELLKEYADKAESLFRH